MHAGCLTLKKLKPGLIPRYVILSSFRNIEKLIIRSNNISELDSEFCCNMPNLMILDASSNEIVNVSFDVGRLK